MWWVILVAPVEYQSAGTESRKYFLVAVYQRPNGHGGVRTMDNVRNLTSGRGQFQWPARLTCCRLFGLVLAADTAAGAVTRRAVVR